MNRVNKILALTLSGFLMLAISGINFHFHICGMSHSLFANIHVAENSSQHFTCDCCNEANKCCSEWSESSGEKKISHNSCVDFEESINIDNIYNITHFPGLIQITEIQLFNFSLNPFISELPYQVLFIQDINLSPPEQEFTSVFLL